MAVSDVCGRLKILPSATCGDPRRRGWWGGGAGNIRIPAPSSPLGIYSYLYGPNFPVFFVVLGLFHFYVLEVLYLKH